MSLVLNRIRCIFYSLYLKTAGVEEFSSEPFELTMKAMNRTMDEIEKILDKKGM